MNHTMFIEQDQLDKYQLLLVTLRWWSVLPSSRRHPWRGTTISEHIVCFANRDVELRVFATGVNGTKSEN